MELGGKGIVLKKLTKDLKWVATILLGLAGLFFLLFGVGESLGGEPGGWMHLVPAVLLLGCIPLAWKNPLWGGVALLVLGFLMGFRLYLIILRPAVGLPPFQPILGLPFLIPGLLFLIVATLSRPNQTSGAAD